MSATAIPDSTNTSQPTSPVLPSSNSTEVKTNDLVPSTINRPREEILGPFGRDRSAYVLKKNEENSSGDSSSPVPTKDLSDPPPTTAPGQKKPKDWIMIAAIIGAIVIGFFLLFAALCWTNNLPSEFLGGKFAAGSLTVVSGLIFVGLGFTIWLRYRGKKNEETSANPDQATKS